MANTFKLKTKSNVGVTTVGIYTATAPVTSTVIIGITLCNTSGSGINVNVGIARTSDDDVFLLKNTPIPQGSTLEFMQGNKIVLETNDSLTARSDTNASLDCSFTIMETTP